MSDLPRSHSAPEGARASRLAPWLPDRAPAFAPSSLPAWAPTACPAGPGQAVVCLHSGGPGSGPRSPAVHGEAVAAGVPPPQDAELLREDGAAAAGRAAAALRRVQHSRVQAAGPDPHARGGPQPPLPSSCHGPRLLGGGPSLRGLTPWPCLLLGPPAAVFSPALASRALAAAGTPAPPFTWIVWTPFSSLTLETPSSRKPSLLPKPLPAGPGPLFPQGRDLPVPSTVPAHSRH